MNKAGRLLLILFLGAWVIIPDLIPGPIDDVVAIVMAINQVSSLFNPAI